MPLDLAAIDVRELHGEPRAIYLELCRRRGGELGKTAEALIAADRRWQEHPLARFRAWAPHCHACPAVEMAPCGVDFRCPRCGVVEQRTSQRAALHTLRPSVDTLVVRGGNRSGKTRLGAAICVAMALGRNDPSVKEWARINRADLSRIQEGPGRVWAVSLTWDTAMEFMRPAIEGYLPPGCVGKNWTQKGQATMTLPGGGVIVNKVVEQGRDAFQGAKIHGLWWDEEPRDDGVVKEGRLRLADHHGLEVFTLTPLSGWTPLMRSLVGWEDRGEAPPADEAHPPPLDGEDNPHVPASYLRKLIGTGFDAASRKKGAITEAEGRVHPGFRREIHVVRSFPIPTDWRRFTAIDFGVRDPFVHLWGALAPDDVLHVYRERYQPERTTLDHAQAIHEAELCPSCWPGGETPAVVGSPDWWTWLIAGAQGQAMGPDGVTICQDCKGTGRREYVEMRWADPEDTNSIATLHRQYDIRCMPAVKARRAGYDAVERRLALDAERRPHIVIHDCCPNAIREMTGLQWAPQTSADEMKVKGDDHAWDTIRYLCLGLERAGVTRSLPS